MESKRARVRSSWTYSQGSFFRVFAGQLLLLVLLVAAAVWMWTWSGSSVVVVPLIAAVLAVISIVGPVRVMARRVIVDESAIKANKYFGRSWLSLWDDVDCAVVLEVPTFGARRRLKIVSRTSGPLFVSDLINDFDDLVAQLKTLAPDAVPCDRPGHIERWLIRG
jgi:hypothetical protein